MSQLGQSRASSQADRGDARIDSGLFVEDVSAHGHGARRNSAPRESFPGMPRDDMAHLMLNDELDESNGPSKNTRTMLWDVTDLRAPKLVGSHYADVQAIDHNLYIKGPLGYLANYCSGLRILDSTQMADGRAPEVAYFDMVDYCDEVAFKGAWSNYPYFKSGTIIVSSIELGLFMLK